MLFSMLLGGLGRSRKAGGASQTVSFGSRTGATHSGFADAMLHSSFATTNFSAENNADNPVIIRFTGISNISGPVTVTDAYITLYLDNGGASSTTVDIREVLPNWVEPQATWNIYSTGNSWGTVGALNTTTDISASNVAQISYPGNFATGDHNSSSNTGLITLVEAWINGTKTNNGVRIALTGPTRAVMDGAGSNAAQRPLLTITYTT